MGNVDFAAAKGKYTAIVIGSSAGGIEALKSILMRIPEAYPLSIFVVQHLGARSPQTLVQFFSSICRAPVKEIEDKDFIKPGVIYFAPVGYHALVEGDFSFSLSVEEPVNYARPSIDVLMETVAEAYKEKAVGIILTGANHDGALGLKMIHDYGGMTVVQDPETAAFPAMPEAAIGEHQPTCILNLLEIGNVLESWS